MSHDLGRAFWQIVRVVPETPLVHRAETRQGGWPYRWSNSLLVRLSPVHALVLGWWHDADPAADELALLNRAILVHREPGDILPGSGPMCGPQLCGVTHVHPEEPADLAV